jgi:hypothetical protein
VGCKGMILKGFGFVAFFAGVKASSFCIHLSCLVCSLSVVLTFDIKYIYIYIYILRIVILDCCRWTTDRCPQAVQFMTLRDVTF